MKARYLCEPDLAASIQANMDFFDKCIEDIKKKKKRLKVLEKSKRKSNYRQKTILEEIEENETILKK